MTNKNGKRDDGPHRDLSRYRFGPNNFPPGFDDEQGPSNDDWYQRSAERAAGPPRGA